MKQAGLKYFVAVGVLGFLFTNFIACGSQMYRMGVGDDMDGSFRSGQQVETAQAAMLHGIHASRGWVNLPIVYRVGTDVSAQALVQIQAACRVWEWAVGKPLFQFAGQHAGVRGDSFRDLYGSLPDGVNGDYFDGNWEKTGKNRQVLATTIWNLAGDDARVIVASDIRYNNEFYILGDSLVMTGQGSREIVDLQSLSIHEIGHLLGLAHIEPSDDPLSIMNPALYIGEGLISRKLSRGDIERIQQIYGCEGEACNIDALLVQQETNTMGGAETSAH